MNNRLPQTAQAFMDPGLYPDITEKVEMTQTQMSFVFLTGKYVYKIKKPVNLGYLDYTTLEKRLFFCRQEVELNRRLSPNVYLGVVPVTRNKGNFSLSGEGEVIDYAVKMLYLPRHRMMNVLLEHNRVTPAMVEAVARKLVKFHSEAATGPDINEFGKIDKIRFTMDENFNQTENYIDRAITLRRYQNIKEYTYRNLEEKEGLFSRRIIENHIRDCHGDLHSAHICFTRPLCIYDCIEFNDRFRYNDIIAEIAFLAMDLDHFGRADLSRVFIETYTRLSRDWQINELLKFYKCYRAYVRGKVGCFKLNDPYVPEEEKLQTLESSRQYFELAEFYTRGKPVLFITSGLVGSGKTTLAQALAERTGATVISSDVVRKRLADVPAGEHRFEDTDSGIYSPEFTRRTYDALFSSAAGILAQGDHVILDASFIRSEERLRAQKTAGETASDFFIIECKLDEENTRRRLEKRLKKGSVSDGRWDIYGPQKKMAEAIHEVDESHYFLVDSAQPLTEQIGNIIEQIQN
ncbi:MAG: AAA family ATPase [Dehalococcoidales bacterium]|nr:AAA family ATPase [Dehalococcoidales bacterium]